MIKYKIKIESVQIVQQEKNHKRLRTEGKDFNTVKISILFEVVHSFGIMLSRSQITKWNIATCTF